MSFKDKKLLIFIENHLLKNNVVKLVIGEPKSLSGGQTHSSNMIQNFHRRITKSFPEIEIKFYDERFTSKIAMQTVLVSGIKKMKRRDKERKHEKRKAKKVEKIKEKERREKKTRAEKSYAK